MLGPLVLAPLVLAPLVLVPLVLAPLVLAPLLASVVGDETQHVVGACRQFLPAGLRRSFFEAVSPRVTTGCRR